MSQPDDFSALERRLRTAFRAHAEGVEPSTDAYARLAERITEPPPQGRLDSIAGSLDAWWRPVAFVTATVVAVGLGAYLLAARGPGVVDTSTAAPAVTDAVDIIRRDAAGDDGAVEADDTAVSDGSAQGDTGDDRVAGGSAAQPSTSLPSAPTVPGEGNRVGSKVGRGLEGLTYAPIGETAEEAATAFLEVLAVDDVTVEAVGDTTVEVRAAATSASTSGEQPLLSTLSLVAIGGGYMVTEAESADVSLALLDVSPVDPLDDDIDDGAVIDGPLAIAVETSAPGLDLTLRSAVDGRTLYRDRDADLPDGRTERRYDTGLIGANRAWVVAAGPATGGAPAAFSARSVLHRGPPDQTSYTVVRLAPNDADGGLVLRQAPNGRRLGVIPLGSEGIRRAHDVPPRLADGLIWWAVITATGESGWVASPYLAANDPIDGPSLIEAARLFAADRVAGVDSRAVAIDRPVVIGSLVDPLRMREPIGVAATWTTKRSLPLGDGEFEGTLEDFYRVDRWAEADVFVPKGFRQAGAGEGANAYFGGLPSAVLRLVDPDTGRTERVHFFFSVKGRDIALIGLVKESEPGPPGADPAGSSSRAEDEPAVGSPTPPEGNSTGGHEDGDGGP